MKVKREFLNVFLEHILVIEIFTLLTILAFHKIFTQGFDRYIIGDYGDAWHFIWNAWWLEKILKEGRLDFFYYTNYLFYPNGAPLYSHTLTPFNSLVILLFRYLSNFIVAYNLRILLSFILSGYTMYLFLSFLVEDRIFRFIGGFFYTFSAYHVSKSIGYLNFLTIEWLPLHFLFVLWFILSKERSLKIVSGIFLTFLIIAFTELTLVYYLFFVDVFLILSFIIFLRKLYLIKLFFALLFACGAVLFIYNPLVTVYFSNAGEYMKGRLSGHTVSFINYFLPSLFSAIGHLFEKYLAITHVYATSSELFWLIDSSVSISYGLLIFAFFGFWFLLKKVKYYDRKINLFISTCFSLLIISIILSVGKSFILNIKISKIIPFYDIITSPARMTGGFIMLFFTILTVYFSQFLFYNKNCGKGWLKILLLIIVGLEIFPISNIQFYSIYIPRIIFDIRSENGNFSILNIPHKLNMQGMFLQTIHNKPILDGHVSRRPPHSFTHLYQLENLIKENQTEELINIFRELKIKYIIVNYNYRGSHDYSLLPLLNLLPVEKVSDINSIKTYKVLL